MRGLIVILGWRVGAPLQSFSIELLVCRSNTLYPIPPSLQGKSTSVLEYGSSLLRHRQTRGNWAKEVPLERVLTPR